MCHESYVSSSSFSSGGLLLRLQWLHFTLLRFFFFGLLTGGLRLLRSIKHPSVTMKTKAKKASSESENILSTYFVFLYLRVPSPPTNFYLWHLNLSFRVPCTRWIKPLTQTNDFIGCFCLLSK